MAIVASVLAAGLVVSTAQRQPSDLSLVISGDPGSPPRYAVPAFTSPSPDLDTTGRTIGEVLWDDLAFEREFYMIPRDTYASVPVARTPDQLPFAAWRELGADAVVFGTVQRTGSQFVVRVRLFDVRDRRMVFGREYSSSGDARAIAHAIADEIHQQQRNLRGVARTRLAFVSDRDGERLDDTVEDREVKEIYMADYDGANARRLTVSRRLNLNPSWAPDGRALAYTTYHPLPDIFVSFIYDGELRNLTNGQGTNYLPVFSPDGSRIAFMSNRGGNTEIYVQNVDGSGLRRLTNHPAYDSTPTWSPSGAQIAFTSDRTGRPQVYVMGADGSNVERLSIDEMEADRATWSPAPYNEIAYAARSGSRYDIKVIDVATREVRQITFGEGSNESPAYAPNGRHLAFTSDRSGTKQIYTIGRDGQGLRQVTRRGNNQTPAWSN